MKQHDTRRLPRLRKPSLLGPHPSLLLSHHQQVTLKALQNWSHAGFFATKLPKEAGLTSNWIQTLEENSVMDVTFRKHHLQNGVANHLRTNQATPIHLQNGLSQHQRSTNHQDELPVSPILAPFIVWNSPNLQKQHPRHQQSPKLSHVTHPL